MADDLNELKGRSSTAGVVLGGLSAVAGVLVVGWVLLTDPNAGENEKILEDGHASTIVGQPANHARTPSPAPGADEKRWVTAERLNRRTCPSAACGIVGQSFFRDGHPILETKDGWARVTTFYDAFCQGGRSQFVDRGNARCASENGVVEGKFAEWVSLKFLSKERPPDPAAGATGDEVLVAKSDDYRRYKSQFLTAANSLIALGRCSKQDFIDNAGWTKSITGYRDQPVYFIRCGRRQTSRFYLNAKTGEIFR